MLRKGMMRSEVFEGTNLELCTAWKMCLVVENIYTELFMEGNRCFHAEEFDDRQ